MAGGWEGTIEGHPGPRGVEGFVYGCNQLNVQPAIAELSTAPRAGGLGVGVGVRSNSKPRDATIGNS